MGTREDQEKQRDREAELNKQTGIWAVLILFMCGTYISLAFFAK